MADQTYPTPNGPKTIAQMQSGLQGAGWNGNYNDPAAVIAAYNSTAAGTSGGGSKGGGNINADAQNLLDAIAQGDTAKFQESIRQFNQDLAEKQREFNTTNYTDLAKSLLSTAAQLRGPADYYQYQQFASGGRDLFKSLYGNQPMPAFTAPSGTNQPASVQSLLQQLGITTSPIGSSANGSTANSQTYSTINGNLTLSQMYAQLQANGWAGDPTDVAGIEKAYGTIFGGTPTLNAAAKTTTNTDTSSVTPAAPAPTMTPQVTTAPSPTLSNQTMAPGGALHGNYEIPGQSTTQPVGMEPGPGTPTGLQSSPQAGGAPSSSGYVPVFDRGGPVHGPIGSHILALLQAGERVIPVNQAQKVGGPQRGPRRYTAQGVPIFDDGGMVTEPKADTTPVGSTKLPIGDPTIPNKPIVNNPTPQPSPLSFLQQQANDQANQRNPSSAMAMMSGGSVIPTSPAAGVPTGPAPATPSPSPAAPASSVPSVPLPYQVNPIVWDSMSPVQQQLILSAVSANGWDQNDWLRMLNAQRPQGSAPAASSTTFAAPVGSFG